jgi:hypothetical protein
LNFIDKTSKKVENYQSDFEHDKNRKYSKDRFIHIARKQHIYLEDIILPEKRESVAYLFGTAKREHILKEGADLKLLQKGIYIITTMAVS